MRDKSVRLKGEGFNLILENKDNLEKQKDRLLSYCAAKGYKVHHIVQECASGLNDKGATFL